MANNHHTQPEPTTLSNHHPLLPANLALDFLTRDYRPTLILALPESQYGEPIRHRLLFSNAAFEKHPELNSDGLHQMFANMAGSSIRIGPWIVHITIIDSCAEDIAVVTASSFENERARFLGSGATTPGSGDLADGVWGAASLKAGGRLPDDDLQRPRRPSISDIADTSDADLTLEGQCRILAGLVDGGRRRSAVSTKAPGSEHARECGRDTKTAIIKEKDDQDRKRDLVPIVDWRKPSEYDPLHFKNLRGVDWDDTAFGPMSGWSSTLGSIALTMMESPVPIALYWGPDYCTMYNNEYRNLAREKDPYMLGKPIKTQWPEFWDCIKPHLDAAYYEGKSTRRETELVAVPRGETGMLEERYFDFTLMPVVQATGIAEGILEIAIEQTNKVVSTRRMETLAKLSNSLRMMQSFDDEFWGRLVNAFDANPIDSPLIIVYRTASSSSDTVQHLQQSLGVTPGGIFAPYMCMANVSNARNCVFHEEMGAAKEQNKVIIKKFTAEARANGELDGRGFDELPAAAAVIPIQISTKSTRGFLILGLNPRRPLDRGYKIWLESIRKELAAAATGVWMRQKEFTRIIEREKHGAIKQSTLELRAELAKRTEDLQRSELFFSQTAETLPVGLLLVDLEGQIYYTNHTARNLFSVKSHTEMNEMWRPNIYAEDTDRVQEAFDHAVVKRETMYTHYRVGNTGADPGWEYWVAASMFVQVDETTAQVSRFMVSLVDMTSHKINEENQRQLSLEAVERRKKQESFIDIFSHELRNPFSATLQSADAILTALSSFQSTGKKLEVEELVDSAQTILVCVQHQMRIIDDVLTLSKLESLALTVVPVNIRPHECVAQMMKIFHSELQVKRIHSRFILEDSYKKNAVWVMADPSRFSQVLVNLLTNAIKFSSPVGAEKCEITVRLAASKERPVSHDEVIYQTYEPPSDGPKEGSQCSGEDWGNGDPLYIQVMVEDTGIGISDKWQAKLFRRFEQVPKTHVTYGGSGLGLFICRRLCRIQGGEIGFHSEEGKGSRFAFFIKACISDRPPAAGEPSTSEFTNLSKFTTDSNSGASTVGNMNEVNNTIPAIPTENPISYRVLIVEDNLINQEVLRRQLRSKGCVTHVANNGQQALEFVKISSFGTGSGESLDIILMDMEMPVMDGCEATRQIRAMQKTGGLLGHVPIMGISANARPEQMALMTEAGMDDAITKPFRIPALLDGFGKLMRKLSITIPPVTSAQRKRPQPVNILNSLMRTASILKHSCSETDEASYEDIDEEMEVNVLPPPPLTPKQLQFQLHQLYEQKGCEGGEASDDDDISPTTAA